MATKTIRTIRRVTWEKYTANDKVRIVLEGLRGERRIREFCRREGIATNLYYSWSNEFLEAGKQRLTGDTQRQATGRDVTELVLVFAVALTAAEAQAKPQRKKRQRCAGYTFHPRKSTA